MNFVVALFVSLSAISVINTSFVKEVRVKVDDLFEKLQYPSKFSKIRHFGSEDALSAAVDFESDFKPKMIQFSMISKLSNSAINFDMKYNSGKSKASLRNLKELNPDMIELAEDYNIKLFVSDQNGQVQSWDLGVLKTPLSLNYNIPDIEDHFYRQEEIFAAGPEKSATINPILPMVGLIMTVLIPLSLFKQLWRKTGAKYSIPSYITNQSLSKAFPAFSVSIIGIVVLIVATWAYFNVFQMLAGLVILGPSAFILGHFSLKALVNSECETENSEKSD